jgi:nitroimidazol reductase NimA-like FMN-containing flavoprotein (pyridoxamine 5'-phosphate oxidase superfamily)
VEIKPDARKVAESVKSESADRENKIPGGITEVRRYPNRASYDKELLIDILKDGFVCHVAFQVNGQPFVIPMMYYSDSEFIYLHASPAARISGSFRAGNPVAISIVELNGLVLAKGIADNSMNYRSAVIFGTPEEVRNDERKLAFVSEWIDHMVPGRKENSEMPTQNELKNVSVFRVKLDQFSVKVRKGGPSEKRTNPEIWSGVIPIKTKFLEPELSSTDHIPDHVRNFIDTRND